MRNEELGIRNEELGVRSEELGIRNEEFRIDFWRVENFVHDIFTITKKPKKSLVERIFGEKNVKKMRDN